MIYVVIDYEVLRSILILLFSVFSAQDGVGKEEDTYASVAMDTIQVLVWTKITPNTPSTGLSWKALGG